MYQSLVESAKKEFLFYQEKENNRQRNKYKSRPSLWPSDLLSCKRKSAYHLVDEKVSLPFNYTSLNYMDSGNIAEDSTARALEFAHSAKQNFPLKNDLWSGKADFVIGHGSRDVTIIEHKATGSNKFSKDKLPKREHVSQLALYGVLYQELYSFKPKLILYYWSWGNFAEFTLDVMIDKINVSGLINQTFVSKNLRINIQKEIKELEDMYKIVMNGGQLPDRLNNKSGGCSFMGKPSCQYYYSCWDR